MTETRHSTIAFRAILALSGLPVAAESAVEREAQDRAQIDRFRTPRLA